MPAMRAQATSQPRQQRGLRRRSIAGAASAISSAVWLWREPQALHDEGARPLLDGRPLQLLAGPERIESGWWDGALAARDYFIAAAADGALVWIYRARLPLSDDEAGGGWFLHGRFA